MNPSFVTKALLVGSAFAFAAVVCEAVPISGTLTTSGTFSLSNTVIDFSPAAGGTGTFTVGLAGAQTGSFVPLAGTTGTIKDLNAAFAPVGVPFSLVDFMLFAADPNMTFRLTFIDPGVFSSAQCGLPAAVGQTCTPFAGSPFNLTNTTATSSELSFSVLGTALNVATSELSSFDGTFSAQFSSLSYQQLLAVVNGGGSVTSSWSGVFTVDPQRTVPEPSALLLACAGFIAFGLTRRGIRVQSRTTRTA